MPPPAMRTRSVDSFMRGSGSREVRKQFGHPCRMAESWHVPRGQHLRGGRPVSSSAAALASATDTTGSRSPQIISVRTATRRRSSGLIRTAVRWPSGDKSAWSSATLAAIATGSCAASTRESSRSGYRRMVSASPIEDIRRISIRRPGFIVRPRTCPNSGVAMSRIPMGIRAPGSSGTDPSMTSPCTRSGRSKAYHNAQVPPPEAPARTAQSRCSRSRTSSTNRTAHCRACREGKLRRVTESRSRSVDEVGAHCRHVLEQHQVRQRRGVVAMQVVDAGLSPDSITSTRPECVLDDLALAACRTDHPVVSAVPRSGCVGNVCLFGGTAIVTSCPSSSSHDPPPLREGPVRTSNCTKAARRWDTVAVGSSEFAGYCSFTKAIEHLGDRWSLLIVREWMFGPQGFNDLVSGLPNRIPRSCSPIDFGGSRLLGWCPAITPSTRTRRTASSPSVMT